jgi:hypothetical protein
VKIAMEASMNSKELWSRYEDVTRVLLDRFREDFGLERVEGKQKVPGKSRPWEIDAKGVRQADDAIVLVECRRRSRRPNAEAVAALAYKISDTGALGGIIVSPLPFQKGAKLVAEANDIVHVQLRPDSTPEEFGMAFLSKILLGLGDHVTLSDHVNAVVTDKDSTKGPC